MRIKSVAIPRGYDGLRIELDGGAVIVRRGLRDEQGREVLSIQVSADADRFSGDPQWWCPDLAMQGLDPTGATIRLIQMDKKDLPEAWKKDAVQFPRLLAEIAAVCPLNPPQIRHLVKSMDLTAGQIVELFARAEAARQRIEKEALS